MTNRTKDRSHLADFPSQEFAFIPLEHFEECAEGHMTWLGCPWNGGETMCDTDQSYCYLTGDHEIEDCSSAGPDSGNMDHECVRCGQYWSVPLY